MVCILSRESVKQTVQPFKGTQCIPRFGIQEVSTMKTTSLVAGYWFGASHCRNCIRQRHIRALTMLFFQCQTHRWLWRVPKVTGQAPHVLAPCPLRKRWIFPSWWMQSNLGAHSQAHEIASRHRCPSCVTQVWNKLSKSAYLLDLFPYMRTSRQDSIGTFALPPLSQRMISKPSGECWNHCQSAKKLEVKLTQRKPRCIMDGQSQLSEAITQTCTSVLCCGYQQQCLDTGKLELSKDSRHKWMPTTLSSPGGNRDAALPAGNPHGSGMSKCTIRYQRGGGWPGTYWPYLLLPLCAPTCTSDWSWCTSPGTPRGLLLRGYIRCSSYKVLMQRPPLALRWAWWGATGLWFGRI